MSNNVLNTISGAANSGILSGASIPKSFESMNVATKNPVIFDARISVTKADNGYVITFNNTIKVATDIEQVRDLLMAEMVRAQLEK